MKKSTFHNKLIYILPIVYILAVSIYMLWHRAWFSPDQFFAFAILATLFIGRTKQFLRDWVPVLLLAFFTFIIFPAMPPWMASNQGYIPPLKKSWIRLWCHLRIPPTYHPSIAFLGQISLQPFLRFMPHIRGSYSYTS